MRVQIVLVPILVMGLAAPAGAGIIFGRKPPKPPPEKRVPELLSIVKNDGDEAKRAEAAEELRQYDPAQFPSIIPTLIDVLLTDKKAGVRTEAAQTLGKIGKSKPVSEQVKLALEYARDKDDSMRVRVQARSSLLGISIFGGEWFNRSPSKLKPDGPPPPKTTEPPLAPPLLPPTPVAAPTITPVPLPLPAISSRPILAPPAISTVPPAPVALPPKPMPSPALDGIGPDLGPAD